MPNLTNELKTYEDQLAKMGIITGACQVCRKDDIWIEAKDGRLMCKGCYFKLYPNKNE